MAYRTPYTSKGKPNKNPKKDLTKEQWADLKTFQDSIYSKSKAKYHSRKRATNMTFDKFFKNDTVILTSSANKLNKPVAKMSSGEKRISDILKKNNIAFVYDKPFNGLVNPKTNQKLRFDFYIHSLKLVIEFDGKQHYKFVKDFHQNQDGLKDLKFRDNHKNTFCRNKGLTMLRISYKDYDKIESILSKYIKHELTAPAYMLDELDK